MKNCSIIGFCLLLSFHVIGQQTESYTQYLLNQYSLNPAVAGSKDCWDIKAGYRKQWLGFDGSPVTYFASVYKRVGIPQSTKRKGWHGLGAYIVNDGAGPTTKRGFYPSYSYHVPLKKNLTVSFGIFVGIRQHIYRAGGLIYGNLGDPVLGSSTSQLLIPDISPGIWLYSKTFFAGLSAKQVFRTRINSLGSPSKLKQHYYLTIGKSIQSEAYYYTYIPSIHVKYTLLYPPSIDLNFMMYIRDNIGFGLGYRVQDAMMALLQLRVYRNLSIGYSFDFTTSRIRNGGSNAHEIVLSYSPCSGKGGPKAPTLCPAYN